MFIQANNFIIYLFNYVFIYLRICMYVAICFEQYFLIMYYYII